VVSKAGAYVNLGWFFAQGLVPEIELSHSWYNARTGAVSAIEQTDKLSVDIFVSGELTFSPVEGYDTSGTTDTNVVHRPFTADNQYFFHSAPFQSAIAGLYVNPG